MNHKEMANKLKFLTHWLTKTDRPGQGDWVQHDLLEIAAALEAEPLARGWLGQHESSVSYEGVSSRVLSIYLDYAPKLSRRVAIYEENDA
jgi:hypothetical protein